jgi:hypothetical protein
MRFNMRRDFWRDLYPISETQRRFARATAVWIYLPIGLGALIALAAAVAVIGGGPGGGLTRWAQTVTIVFSAILLAAGFAALLLLLAAIGALEYLLEVLPFFTSRLRLRVVVGARWGNRTLNKVRHSIEYLTGIFSTGRVIAIHALRKRMPGSRRGGKRYG